MLNSFVPMNSNPFEIGESGLSILVCGFLTQSMNYDPKSTSSHSTMTTKVSSLNYSPQFFSYILPKSMTTFLPWWAIEMNAVVGSDARNPSIG